MSEESNDKLETAQGDALELRRKGREALYRVAGKTIALAQGEWRGYVHCPNCQAVLMSGTMIMPGHYEPDCLVCGLTWSVEVSGGPVTALAAVAASVGDSMADALTGFAHRAELRRGELRRALESGEMADPFTATVFGSVILAKIIGAIAISAVVAGGTALLTRALTPRQKFTTGQVQGTLNVPQSEQGIGVTEGYGGDPGSRADAFRPAHAYALEDRVVHNGYFYVVTTAGTSASSAPTFPTTKGETVTSNTVTFTCYGRTGGGFRLPMLIVWTSGLRKHDERVQRTSGGKGPKPPEETVRTYDLDLAVMPGRGPLTVKRIRANTENIFRNYDGGIAYYEAESATKTGGASNTSDALASGGVAVSIPQNGAVEWTAVGGDGTASILEFYYKSSVPITVEFTWVGGAGTTVFQDTLNSTGGLYVMGYNSAAWLLNSGSGNTVKIKNLSATALIVDRLGVRLSGGATGVPDSTIEPDDDYNADAPPTPNDSYNRPLTRFSGELDEDGDGVRTGTVQAGSYAGIAIYPGNATQLPDPTIQAAVDALYGSDSTPAFWNRCLIMLRNFYLTKYGGAIPIIQTLAEHQTLDTYEAIFGHMSGRTGVLTSSDYNYSGARRLFCRGFPVTPPYAPADVMEELARVNNIYFRESDKLYAFERNSQGTVATLTSANLGWVDGDAEDEEGELPALDFDLAPETEIARRYEITAVDPERDFEQNSQGTSRQVTSSEKTEKIELALTLYPDEMREITQRELYEEHVESTKHRLDLDWSYLWLQPGDSVTVTEDDGTTSRIFIESFTPNVGVCPAEGSAEETAVYSQTVSTSGGGVFEVPPVPIPGMVLLGVYDGPLLTDAENSINNGLGFYAWAVKRRGDGEFAGSVLKMDRGLGFEPLATFDREAVFGVTASTLTASTDIHAIVADALTVDLHNEDDTLESVTADELRMGAKAAIAGTEVVQILSAEREPDTVTYPNRWYLTIGLRARRGTDFAVDTHTTGERFVLIDDAVQFIPMNANEVGVERDYIMVASGQSEDDAAVVSRVFEGGSVKHLAPANVRRHDDADFNSLVEWDERLRMGHGLHQGLSGFSDREREIYDIEIFSDGTRATVKHSARVEGMLGEEIRIDNFSDYNDLGALIGARGVGQQRLPYDNSFVSARFNDVQTDTSSFGLVDVVGANYTPQEDGYRFYSPRWLITCSVDPATGLNVLGTDGVSFTQGVAYTENTADVHIEIQHGRLLFYLNRYDGGGAPLFSVSYPDLSARDLRAYFFHLNDYAIFTNRVQGRVQRFYEYKAADQIAEFGSEQATQYWNIYRYDPRVGRGYPAKVTLVR